MTDDASQVLDAALKLSAADQAEIAAILADSIGDGSSPEEVEASWIVEAKRRLAEYERGEITPIDLEEVMRELEAEISRPLENQASPGWPKKQPTAVQAQRRN